MPKAFQRVIRLAVLLKLSFRSVLTAFDIWVRGMPGAEFDVFGRKIGLWLLIKIGNKGLAREMWLHPIVGPRYFEFSFAKAALSGLRSGIFLDISSPRLFSFFVAAKLPTCKILMANPDASDAQDSALLARTMNVQNIVVSKTDVAGLSLLKESFDSIWAISVIEHISGPYDDIEAVRWMYAKLKPAGRLILTFPVDRQFWTEYRSEDLYGVQPFLGEKGYFYQRFYDREAIDRRLLGTIPLAKASFGWYGETKAGWFANFYEPMRRSSPPSFEFKDARLVSSHFRYYNSWEEMPGMGICGLVLQKP